MKKVLLTILAMAPVCSAAAVAQQRVSQQDRQFVDQAAAGGRAEIAAGKLAEAQAGNPAVREFGRWMVTDHTMMAEMLQFRARQAGITVPTATADEASLNSLKSLHDAQFDKTYVAQQVEAHNKTIALFQKEIQSGENPGLKSVARFAMPALQQHLAEAKDLQTLSFATTSGGQETSLPTSAPAATTTRATTSNAQGPVVKQMNQSEKARVEQEGK